MIKDHYIDRGLTTTAHNKIVEDYKNGRGNYGDSGTELDQMI